MRKWIIGILFISLSFIGCENNTNIDEDPIRVKWVRKTPDDSLCIERGIDAYSEQGLEEAIVLEWEKGVDTDIDSYLIYTTDADTGYGYPVNFLPMSPLSIKEAGNNGFEYNYFGDDSYTYFFELADVNLSENTNCYFYIMAKDKGGNYSEHSDTIQYHLIAASSALDYNSIDNYFTWVWPNEGASAQVILRIDRMYSDWEPYYVRRIDGSETQIVNNYYDNPKIYLENLSVSFPAGVYRFRVDNSFGDEYRGAESRWRQFSIN